MSDDPETVASGGGPEAQGSTSPPPGGTRRPGALPARVAGGRWHRRALVALGAACLALLVTTVTFAVLWQESSEEADRLDAVRRAAGGFATQFLTIDTTDPDAWKEAVLELSTGAFRRTFEEGLETQLVQAFFALDEAQTDVTVEELFVGDVDSRTAHAVAHAEVATSLLDEEGVRQRRPGVDVYLELDLVRQDGEWLVDALNHLNFGGGGGAGGASS